MMWGRQPINKRMAKCDKHFIKGPEMKLGKRQGPDYIRP